MSLADLLVLRPEFRTRALDTTPLDTAIRKIENAFPGIGPTSPVDMDAVVRRVTAAFRSADWHGITVGDVSIVMRASLLEESPIPEDLRRFLDAEAHATTVPQLLDALARAYLETWSERSPRTRRLQGLLLARANLLPDRWKNLFMTCPDFLDIEAGPWLVGGRMVATDTPYQWLRSIGLASPHGPGFMRLAHTAFLRRSPDPQTFPALDKLLAWAAPTGEPALDDNRAAEVVDRILLPWTTKICPADYREPCLARLIDRFGDPRRENPAFWALVAEPNRRVLNLWLARKSMEAMFEVVTEAERGSASSHQWPARRRFWMGLYEEGRIDEAWIALGDNAVPIARSLHRRTNDKSYLSYGRQITRSDTCLLFMRIGKKTFVEGSHNFRVHAFPTTTRQTPTLYATTYDLNEILLPHPHDDARVHIGEWMGWVRDRIRNP